MAWFDSEIDVYIALPTFYAGADALFIKPFNDGCVKAVNFADKTGDKQVFWLFIDFTRRAVLLNHAITHYHDTIGHGERFFLIVSDKNKRDTEFTL